MENEWIHQDETLEELQLDGLKILQKKKGFRFGMDSVLLSHFADIRPYETVVDFGTGTGILLLLLFGRGKGCSYYGIEIQQEYCDMAKRTICMNHLEDRMTIYCGDAGKSEDFFLPCSTDAVICNPPYSRPGAALISPFSDRAKARNQDEDTLRSFLCSAFRILRGKGRVYMVYPAAQMLQIMSLMAACHIEPKRFQLVYPQIAKPANLVLIEGVKDAKPMLHPMKPLIVFDDNQDLTKEMKSIYHINE